MRFSIDIARQCNISVTLPCALDRSLSLPPLLTLLDHPPRCCCSKDLKDFRKSCSSFQLTRKLLALLLSGSTRQSFKSEQFLLDHACMCVRVPCAQHVLLRRRMSLCGPRKFWSRPLYCVLRLFASSTVCVLIFIFALLIQSFAAISQNRRFLASK